jgi:hypothetical protein
MRQQIREYWYIAGRTIHNIDTHKRLINDAYMQRYKLVAMTMWLNSRLSTIGYYSPVGCFLFSDYEPIFTY